MDDLISRQATIDALISEPPEMNYGFYFAEKIKAIPPVQPECLTDDEIEVIRIHLSAFKERLCNHHRWEEAEKYQRIINHLKRLAYANGKRESE